MTITSTYINGAWVAPTTLAPLSIHNPSTGEFVATVPNLDDASILDAINGSHTAFEQWSLATARERASLLRAIEQKLLEKEEKIAKTITTEMGKPLAEARGEVRYTASYFGWFAGEAERVYGDIVPADASNKRLFVLKQPIGVTAAITPWNFPLAMPGRKIAAALAAGCSMIVKPAPESPLSLINVAEIFEELGAPAGIFNIVTGDATRIGALLTSSRLVKKITFTGSTEVGKLLYRQSADTVKKLTLELGGNAPFIVLDEAHIDLAVEAAMFGKYRNAGQTCICVNRFLVHSSCAALFAERLAERSQQLRVGDGFAPETQIGPLVSDRAVEKVERLVSDAVTKGASVTLASAPRSPGSRFVTPTVLCGITTDMDLWREEVFGPVSAIASFSSDEEALRMANDTQYGLAAYVFATDFSRALKFAERLQYGMVGINDTTISATQAPFGGVKESGFGREGGKEGIEEYLVPKYISARL